MNETERAALADNIIGRLTLIAQQMIDDQKSKQIEQVKLVPKKAHTRKEWH